MVFKGIERTDKNNRIINTLEVVLFTFGNSVLVAS